MRGLRGLVLLGCLALGAFAQAPGIGVGASSGPGGGTTVAVQANGAAVGSQPTLNFIPAAGITNTLSDTGTKINIQQGVDYAVTMSVAAEQAGSKVAITTTSSSGTTYTGTMAPTLTAYTKDQVLAWDVGSTLCTAGAVTINIDTLGAKSIKEADGTTNLVAGDCGANQIVLIAYDGTVFRIVGSKLSLLSKFMCEPGIGDGLNAIPAGTYLQSTCVNKIGSTVTITGIWCFTDNSGTSTMNVTNAAGTAMLTGAITCSATSIVGAAGTQGATVTLADGDGLKFTFVADGTSKQTAWNIAVTK